MTDLREHERKLSVLDRVPRHNVRNKTSVVLGHASDIAERADAVEIRVAGDGPGLSDTDRRALLRGAESPLEHTQGLGLWLVRWSAEVADGEIDIAENDPRGTVVTVRLPTARGAG